MKVFSLSSGSKGNCTFVKGANTNVLVDAGISMERIKSNLKSKNENFLNLNAVLISHEHADHTYGLSQLVKNLPHMKIYAHEKVCEKLAIALPSIKNNLEPIVSPTFYIGDFTISATLIPHDSVACLSFSIFQEDKKFSIATDIGKIPQNFLNEIYDSNLLFLESNHSVELLKACDKYHFLLKKRILGDNGHLSNESCASFLCKVVKKRQSENMQNLKIVLCHISENTNTIEKAREEIAEIFSKNEITIDYTFATQEYGTEIFDL